MALTARETQLLTKIRSVMPDNFQAESTDDKLLAFGDLVIGEINWTLPYTNFNRETFPIDMDPIYTLGVQIYGMLFKQMEATLQDFDYSDSGLSVRVDQVGKINTAQVNFLKMYQQQVDWAKKAIMLRTGGVGLGTPRFQSQIGQFLKLSLGSAFNWK